MKHRITDRPLHLGLGATARPQPAMSGTEWYADYEKRTADDGAEGRLVSQFTFTESWDSWERHPAGEEVVLCLAGRITLLQEVDGEVSSVEVEAGDYVVNPPGVWHTADVEGEATALFITPGTGTEHKLR